VALDLKDPAAIATCLALIERADALIEGFRPGVMERLGLGPDVARVRNRRLIYGRMTGWGQDGPLAQAAGHDLNYIALSGALHAVGRHDRPSPPLNLVGDFGGGLYLAMGLLAGILNARATGRGQVVDCAMSDGAASMMSIFFGMLTDGAWRDARESNTVDGGSHYYNVYQCADGAWVSVAAMEPQFYAQLLRRMGLPEADFKDQNDPSQWEPLRARMAEVFATRTRAEWCRELEGTDACFAPVMALHEAPEHPHNVARRTFVDVAGVLQPGPVPRFSETPGGIQGPPAPVGRDNLDVLRDWGLE
jgi:alpha-methylacyl-CoA racemase